MFGPIQAIENQLTEEGKSHLTCNGEMLFYLLVRQKDLVATIFATYVEVFAQLIVSLRPENIES